MKIAAFSALTVAALTLSACGGGGSASASGNALARCSTCHAVKAGDPKRSGPSLVGIIGKKAGGEPGYAYSAAMKDSGIVWTPDQLDAFMAAPNSVIPGNRMGFAGEGDAANRKAIIAALSNAAQP